MKWLKLSLIHILIATWTTKLYAIGSVVTKLITTQCMYFRVSIVEGQNAMVMLNVTL